MCNFAIEAWMGPSCAGSNQSPSESLKLDTGRDLRSVGRNFIEITAAIVIVIEIAEAKFVIDAPGSLGSRAHRRLAR